MIFHGNKDKKVGTEGRSRTDTVSPPLDFESSASTSSATPAQVAHVSLGLIKPQARKSRTPGKSTLS